MKNKIITISLLIILHLAIILTVCGIDGLFTETLPPKEVTRFVCDAFYVASMMYLCIGGLIWVTGEGLFNGVGYAVSNWMHSVFHNTRDWKKKESFQEYRARKEKKKAVRVNEVIIIGGISLIVASILLLVYQFAF